MSEKKVLIVIGTRPEAIKMAPVIKKLETAVGFQTLTCVTAQHRELLDQVLHVFQIEPDFDLDLMKKGQDLFDITTKVLTGLRTIFTKAKPDLVIVHGDTTTSSIAALAAFYCKIRVAHVEAGLRTHNLKSPWPEEANRQLTARLADIHFAPTIKSKQHLIAENIDSKTIEVTGNTVIDALFMILDNINSNEILTQKIRENLEHKGIPNELLANTPPPYVLLTSHRRENFGQGLQNICVALKVLSIKFPEVSFIYPMHFNPNIRKPIREIFGSDKERNLNFPNLYFIEPLDYQEFIFLMSRSRLILTDSGGIQEEAPSLGKPVLVMRDTTERPEAVSAGTVRLVGTNTQTIIEAVSELLTDINIYERMALAHNPYGDGKAVERILHRINKELQ
tara:strand:- start:1334 stop:2512 length:1179 start_codon:yes stop_codon:yes gene_type:complete